MDALNLAARDLLTRDDLQRLREAQSAAASEGLPMTDADASGLVRRAATRRICTSISDLAVRRFALVALDGVDWLEAARRA